MSKGNIITIAVAVLVVLGGAYYGLTYKKNSVAKVDTAASVATVDGVAIPRSEYDTQYASAVSTYQTQGVDINDSTKLTQIQAQVMDNLVNNELLRQASVKAGITAPQTDVDAQYQTLLAQAGGAEQLKTQLAAIKISDTQLRENIAKQLAIRTYILSKIDISSATSTSAEVTQFYNDNVKGQKDAPALKDIKAQIEAQIVANKQQTLLNALISSLRTGAKIELKAPAIASSTPTTTP